MSRERGIQGAVCRDRLWRGEGRRWVLWWGQRCMSWGGHGCHKVSLGPTMPYPSMACGRAIPETALWPFQRWPARKAGAYSRLLPLCPPPPPRRTPLGAGGKRGAAKRKLRKEISFFPNLSFWFERFTWNWKETLVIVDGNEPPPYSHSLNRKHDQCSASWLLSPPSPLPHPFLSQQGCMSWGVQGGPWTPKCKLFQGLALNPNSTPCRILVTSSRAANRLTGSWPPARRKVIGYSRP
jgi:hypothetical protein